MRRAPLPSLSFFALVAGRLIVRTGRPGTFARFVPPIAGFVAAACGGVVLLGPAGVGIAWPLVAASAALVAVGALCVRLLTPTVAVSVFGMALGCAALMSVFAVTRGFEYELTLRLSQVNGHVLVTKYGLDFRNYDEIVERWKDDPRVRAASPFAYSMAAIVPAPGVGPKNGGGDRGQTDAPPVDGATATPAVVVAKGLDPALAADMTGVRRVLTGGDPVAAVRPGDTRHYPGLALGVNLAARLDVGPGDHVRMVIPAALGDPGADPKPPRHAVFEVLDTIDTGVTELDGSLALVHLSAGQALFFRQRRVTGIEFELHDPNAAEEVKDAILAGLDDSLFRASTWQQQSASTMAGLRQIRAAVGLVLGLLELVAGSALVASLLLLIRRKRVEIAGLVALGADRRAVFRVFEAVGLVAGLLGAAAGLLLGGFFCSLLAAYRYPLHGDVYPIDHLPVSLTAIDVVVPALAAILICALVSGPVALLAARQPVLEGLRR